MSFDDHVKARRKQLKEQEAQQEAQEKVREREEKAAYREKCQGAWKKAINDDEWPTVKWDIEWESRYGAHGYGSFRHQGHEWLVIPDFREQPPTWTWNESNFPSPRDAKTSKSDTLRDDLLNALADPPRKPQGFMRFD